MRFLRKDRLATIGIVAIYILFGSLWILFSISIWMPSNKLCSGEMDRRGRGLPSSSEKIKKQSQLVQYT